MQTIDNFDFNGKRALVRVDFNVPMNAQFEITDTTRIDATIPTIAKILDGGGSVILMSHLGRPKRRGNRHSPLLIWNLVMCTGKHHAHVIACRFGGNWGLAHCFGK